MRDRILKILSSVRSDVEFEKEQALIDDGIIESFDVIQIVMGLMEEFDIYIDADDIEPENLNSLEAICQTVQRKIEAL